MPKWAVVICVTVLGFVSLALLFVGLWLLLPRAAPDLFASLPSDAKMIKEFNEHREQYEELLRMFQENAHLDAVDGSGDWPEHSTVGLSETRSRRYATLCRELDVLSLERHGDAPGKVFFVTRTLGIAPSGSQKGFVYSEETPSRVVDDTDHSSVDVTSGLFRRIEGDWYIWRFWW